MNVAENRSERSHAHGRRHRCRHNSHKTANVLNALPKSAHPGAKAALAEIYNAEDAEHARTAVTTFEADFGAKWPKAVAKITEDLDVLLEFYTYPAEHWVHLRTTTPDNDRVPPSPPFGCGNASPKSPVPAPLAWRWHSSSSSQHSSAGARSTHLLWCRSCELVLGPRRANSSNDPTTREANSKSHDTPIHRS